MRELRQNEHIMPNANMNDILDKAYPASELGDFCRRHGIRSLALFGSALHGNFHPNSDIDDIDLLVEYDPQQKVGLFAMTQMEAELFAFFGQPVDLRTAPDLSPYFRNRVLAEAQTLYKVPQPQ